MVDVAQFAQFLVNGLVVGSILTLTAVGLTLVYGILNLPNFSHGDLVTLGAYLGLFFTALIGLPTTMAWATWLVVALLAVAAFDRLIRPRLVDRWDVFGNRPRHGLAAGEAATAVYAALALTAVMTGLRFPVDVPTRTGVLAALALAVVALAAHAVPARRRGEDAFEAVPTWTRIGLAAAGLLIAYFIASPLVLGVVMALAAVSFIVTVLDLVVWRRLRERGAGMIMLIITSIGLALFARNLIIMEWGGGTRSYPETRQRGVPVMEITGIGPLLDRVGLAAPQALANVTITPNQAMVLVISIGVIVGVHVLLQYTRVGKAMRALSDNVALARITGIDVDRVILYVWVIAGSLAALSGILLGQIRAIHPNLGWFLLLPIFASVILGGIGHPYGAMAGGFTIGIAMEVSPFFGVPVEYKLAVGFAILILVLLVRPRGIFGGPASS